MIEWLSNLTKTESFLLAIYVLLWVIYLDKRRN